MTLKKLLILQVIYAVLGVGYNVISYLIVSAGGEALSSTVPVVGGAYMLGYGVCLIPGFFKKVVPYRVLMGAAIFIFGYGGVVKHILNAAGGHTDLYSSKIAFILAVGINVFGLVWNIWAATGRFSVDERA
ncbi:MAG: hypothetical protein JW885_01965 [Deltaproteobacteria bacterium]|nr:hypothetical protein [Candidatus Zymogenaceae bacterium]